jgi:hypothetical protein
MGWTNSDGLYIKFGTEEATAATSGMYNKLDNEHEAEVVLTLTALGTSAARVGSETLVIPSGARITKVTVLNQTAATSGGSATLNVGLQRLDRSTELDYDGLLVTAPLADFNAAGETKEYIIGVTGVGALVGTTTAYPGYITADYDTAAFTAGVVRVKIFYYFP